MLTLTTDSVIVLICAFLVAALLSSGVQSQIILRPVDIQLCVLNNILLLKCEISVYFLPCCQVSLCSLL